MAFSVSMTVGSDMSLWLGQLMPMWTVESQKTPDVDVVTDGKVSSCGGHPELSKLGEEVMHVFSILDVGREVCSEVL